MAMFAAFPSTIMEAALARPTSVDSMIVAGKAANLAIQLIPITLCKHGCHTPAVSAGVVKVGVGGGRVIPIDKAI